MKTKARFNAVLKGEVPDRLPVVTHHLMPYSLQNYLGGISQKEFFKKFGIDEIAWVGYLKVDESKDWHVETEDIPDQKYKSTRYNIDTPKGRLTMVIQKNDYTQWVTEYPIKEDADIEKLDYFPRHYADVEKINAQNSEDVILRGTIPGFDIFGQPGCWQDAACLYGIENLIMKTYDDPQWVRELLERMMAYKLEYVESIKGAEYDIIELGGGDASSTVISPGILDEFVAPYDAKIIEAAHKNGQKIVYHTCGGMMPILENLLSMKPDALETFTPPEMGGDTDLAKAKKIIDGRACMIGGFDQGHYFTGCTPEETRAAVRRCFEAAGEGGGYVLSPSDHFFEAQEDLIMAFADEARKCTY